MINNIKKTISLMLAFILLFTSGGVNVFAETLAPEATTEPVAQAAPPEEETEVKQESKYVVGLTQSGHGTIKFSDTNSSTKKLPPGSDVSLVITPENGWYLDYIVDSDTGETLMNGPATSATLTTGDGDLYIEPVFAKEEEPDPADEGSKKSAAADPSVDSTDSGEDAADGNKAADTADGTEAGPAEDAGELTEAEEKTERHDGAPIAKVNADGAGILGIDPIPFDYGKGGFSSKAPVTSYSGQTATITCNSNTGSGNVNCLVFTNQAKSGSVWYEYNNAGVIMQGNTIIPVTVRVYPWITCYHLTDDGSTIVEDTGVTHYYGLSLATGAVMGGAQLSRYRYNVTGSAYCPSGCTAMQKITSGGYGNCVDQDHNCVISEEFHFYDSSHNEITDGTIAGTVFFDDLDHPNNSVFAEGVRSIGGTCLYFVTGDTAIEKKWGFMVGSANHEGGSTDFASAGIAFRTTASNPFTIEYQNPRANYAHRISHHSVTLTYVFDGLPQGKTADQLYPLGSGNNQIVLTQYTNTAEEAAQHLFSHVEVPGYRFEGWKTDMNKDAVYTGVPMMVNSTEIHGKYVKKTGTVRVHKTIRDDSGDSGQGLAGFTFTLSGKALNGETISKIATTNSSGYATFTEVPISTDAGYTLTEGNKANWTQATVEHVFVRENETTDIDGIENVYKVGTVKIIKNVVNNTGFGHTTNDGFIFTVSGTDAGGHTIKVRRFGTETDGVITIPNIPFGTYTVNEETPTNGVWSTTYSPANKQVTVSQEGEATAGSTITVTNTMQSGKIRVYKEISDPTGTIQNLENELRNCKFSLYSRNTNNNSRTNVELPARNITTVTDRTETTVTGYVEFDNLPCGDYVVTEEGTGDNEFKSHWKVDSPTKNVTVTSGGTATTTFTDTFLKGNIKIIKHVNVPEGAQAPANVTQGFKFEITGENLYGSAVNTITKTVTTGADGTVTVSDLPLGKYHIKEIETPSWFTATANFETDVVVSEDKTSTVNVYNNYDVGDLKVHKEITDPTNTRSNPMGFGYKLSGTSDSEENISIGPLYTDANGDVTFKNVPVGNYSISEVQVPGEENEGIPEYWSCDQARYNVRIDRNRPTEQTFHNTYLTGTVEVIKDINDLSRMASLMSKEGYSFTLSGETVSGDHYEKTMPTLADGRATFVNVPIGTYTVTETGLPNGASVNETNGIWKFAEPQQIRLQGQDLKTVVMTNTVNTWNPKVKKTVSGNDAETDLQGFKFKLSGYIQLGDGRTEIEPRERTTDENGNIDFGILPVGRYIIEEIDLPDYWKNPGAQTYTATAADDGQEHVFEFENVYKTGLLYVQKSITGKDTNDLSGFKFKLSGVTASNKNYEATSDFTTSDGRITFDNIPVGTYKIEEVGADGRNSVGNWWVKAEDKEDITVLESPSYQTIPMENIYKTGNVKVTKRVNDPTNADPNKAGFTFELTGRTPLDEEIGPVRERTNEQGEALFTNIPVGEYTVREVGTPDTAGESIGAAWSPLNASQTVRVEAETDGTPKTSELTFTNTYKTGNLTVNKEITNRYQTTHGQSSVTKEGFKFRITLDTNPDIFFEKTTNEEGEARFTNIPAGIYTLTEVATPDGNGSVGTWWTTSSEQKVTITYDDENQAQGEATATVTNEYQVGKVIAHKELIDPSNTVVNDNGTPKVDGFVFRLYGHSDSGEEIELWKTTTTNGTAIFDDIPVGDYDITEVKEMKSRQPVQQEAYEANNYWNVSPLSARVHVDGTTVAEPTITNTFKTGDVKVVKVIEPNTDNEHVINNLVYSGFKFKLYGRSLANKSGNNDVEMIAETNEDGIAMFENVPVGKYTLTEISTNGYDSEPWWTNAQDQQVDVIFNPDGNREPVTVIMANSMNTGEIRIKKEIEDNSNTYTDADLSNFGFKLTGKTASGITLEPITVYTDSSGEATITGVPVGTRYTVEEISTPDSDGSSITSKWVVLDRSKTAKVKKNEETLLTFRNRYKTRDLEVTKELANPSRYGVKSAAGFKFRLTRNDTDKTYTASTEENGENKGTAVFKDLPIGRYTLEEISSPDDVNRIGSWWDHSGPKNVEITYDSEAATQQPVRVTMENRYKTGKVEVQKEVEDPSEIFTSKPDYRENFTFMLTGTSDSGEDVKEWAKTNRDGLATFDNIPAGSHYTITEVTGDREETPIVEENADAFWDVRSIITAPVSVEDGTTTRKTVTNIYKTGNLEVTKVINNTSDIEIPLSGFTFRLSGTSRSGEPIELYETTDTSGKANFTNVPIGTYTLSETGTDNEQLNSADWWTMAQDQEVTISYGSNATRVAMMNNFDTGTIRVIKEIDDPSGTADNPAGFGFKLTGKTAQGTMLPEQTAYTNSDGYAYFGNVPVGSEYIVTEISSPGSGTIDRTKWSVEEESKDGIAVTSGNQTDVRFENRYKTNDLILTKTVTNDSKYGVKTAEGFVFTLASREYPTLKFEQTTGRDGKATFENLPVGEYTLEEKASPDSVNTVGSWWTTRGPQDITITYDDNVTRQEPVTATASNIYKVGDIHVTKTVTDPSGKYTSTEGYYFMLTGKSASGEDVQEWAQTGENSPAVFKDIPVGDNYTVTEVKAMRSEEPFVPEDDDSAWDVRDIRKTGVSVSDSRAEGYTPAEVGIENILKTGSLKVIKLINTDAFNPRVAEALARKGGFTFRLHGRSMANKDGSTEDVNLTAKTDEDGHAEFTNVPVGTYTLTEVGTDNKDLEKSPWWTTPDDVEVDVLYGKETAVSMTNCFDTGTVKVTKNIEDPSGKHIDRTGYGFKLTGTTASGIELEEEIRYTGEDGTCTFTGIPVGTEYIITEISSPGSDAVDPVWDCAQVKKEHIEVEKEKTTEVEFTNTYKTGILIVHNHVINNAYVGMEKNESDPVPKSPGGFMFKIVGKNPDGTPNENLVYTSGSDEDGNAVFNDLPVGDYTLTEIATVDGNGNVGDWWNVTGSDVDFTITYNETTELDVNNEYQVGNLTVQKDLEDSTGQNTTLSDFVFYLEGTSKAGKKVKVWATTDGEGKANFVNIPVGTYGLTEVSALGRTDQLLFAGPETYWDVLPRFQRVTITDHNTTQTAEATIKNIYKSGKLIVKKVIKNDSVFETPSLKGFTFQLSGTSLGNDYVNNATATTNEDGIAVFEDIPVGSELTLKEIGTKESNTHAIDTWWDVPDEKAITITYDQMPYYEMTNVYKLGNVHVQKIIDDPSGKMDDQLDGFKFRLHGRSDWAKAAGLDQEDVDVSERTDHNGEYTFTNIPVGTYTLEEVASPGREDLDPKWNSNGLSQEVRVEYGETTDKEFTNTYATGNLIVTKQLKNDSRFGVHDKKDFVFRLTRLTDQDELDERYIYEEKTGEKTGTIVGTTRIKDEQAVFENIPAGRYKLTEVDTPEEASEGVGSWWTVKTDPEDGIITIENDQETNDQTTKHATVTNTYKVGNVEVHKDMTDPSNTYKTRSGFIFQLTGISESGVPINMEAETDGDGYALFQNVPIGTHYLITEREVFNDDNGVQNTGPDSYWDIQPRTRYVDVVENETTGADQDIRIENIYKTGDLTVEKIVENASDRYGVQNGQTNGFRFHLHGKSYKNENLDYEDVDLYATTGEDWITYGKNWEVTSHDGEDGKAHFAGIPIGVYQLEEVSVPDYGNGIANWWEPSLSRTITITYGDEKFISMTNRYKTGDIEVRKLVEDPTGLAESTEGFYFKLEGTSASGVPVVEVEQTNKYGIAQFTDIPVGKDYKIYEIGTPEDATNIPEWWDNTEAVEGRGRSVEIVDKKATDDGEADIPVQYFTNIYKTGNINLKKLIREDSFNDGISKEYFAFRLTGTSLSGKEIEKYAVTDENGDITFTDIPIGDDYTISEVSKKDVQDAALAGNIEARKIAHLRIHTLDGYITRPPIQGIKAEYNNEQHTPKDTTVTFTNEQTKAMINIMDYDTDVELDDVVLRIRNTQTNETIVYSMNTIHENNNIIYGLQPGQTYTITEVRPRAGYSFNLYKKDGFRSKYADTGFEFEDETFDGIELEPEISETDPNEATFTMTDQSGIQIVSLFNKPVKSELTVHKEGEVMSAQVVNNEVKKYKYDIKGLPGAEYTIKAAEDIKYLDGYTYHPLIAKDTVVARLTTDDDGNAVTPALYLGKYEIEETKAPRGYFLNEEKAIKTIDLYEKYVESNFRPGQARKELYEAETVSAESKYRNDRQILDLGTDPEPGDIPFDDPRDPLQDNYQHTGIYKIGMDGNTETYVEGAEFTLYAAEDIIGPFGEVTIPKDTKIETAVSGDDGRATFHSDLPSGRYYIKETKAPDGYFDSNAVVYYDTAGYEDNDEVHFIRLTGEIRNAVTSVNIFLKDDKTLNELAGASLNVKDTEGNPVDAWITSNTDGTGYIIKGLDPGKEYILTETAPRDGYTNNVIIPDEMDGVLTPYGTNAVKFTVPEGTTDESLTDVPEATNITIMNRFVTGSVIVNKKGEILKSAQSLWSKHQFVGQVIDWVKTIFSFGSEGSEGIEFTVYASEDIYHPDGVTGLLYSKDEPVKIKVRSDEEDAVLTTDATGKAVFEEMYLGHFYVKETNRPEGYITNEEKKPFTLAQKDFVTDEVWATEGTVEFVNKRQRVSLKVNKADRDDHTIVLSDAVFGLYAKEDILSADGDILIKRNTLIETQATDDKGTAVFEADLPLGKYYIQETAAPEGYVLEDGEIHVNATWKENGPLVLNFEYNVYNRKTKVYIDKYIDGTSERIRNVDLGVYHGNDEIDRFTTTGQPHLIEGLTIGREYILKELKPAPGYATAKDMTFTVENPDEEEIQRIIMRDAPIKISIRTLEVNKNGREKELEKVKMHLENADGQTVSAGGNEVRWTSTELPEEWDKIPAGDYRIVVDSVPDGYVKPEPVPITVKDTPDNQKFDVKVPTINIDIIPKDKDTNEPIDNVTATIYSEDGNPVYENVDLEFIMDKVPAGNYTVEITDVPEGYVIPGPFDITVESKKDPQVFEIPIDTTDIVINAKDAVNNDPVEDVIVTVYDENGNPVRSDVPLEYATKKLAPGKYRIHVNSVPAGYTKPDKDTDITVKNTNKKQTFSIVVEPINMFIKAIDNVTNEEMVNNVYATVYDKDGHKIFSNVPLAYLKDHVTAGEYTIRINEVPDGYIIPDDLKIKVNDQKGTQTFVVPVGFTKTAYEVIDDETGDPVKGVKMKLVNKNGKTVAEWTSEKGWYTLTKLIPGDYQIVTESVPKGYAIPGNKKITIRAVEDLQQFIIKLKKGSAVKLKTKTKTKGKTTGKKATVKNTTRKAKAVITPNASGKGTKAKMIANANGKNARSGGADTKDFLIWFAITALLLTAVQAEIERRKKKAAIAKGGNDRK